MSVVETIREKVIHLPPRAQEEVLRHVEQIEERYHNSDEPSANGNGSLRELFGSVSLGRPTGSDNESIDADIAREALGQNEGVD